MTPCKRCGQPFEPWNWPGTNRPVTVCQDCAIRNLFDGLGLVTPPEMLDPHTKIPALTKDEYLRKLNEDQEKEGHGKDV